MHYDVESRIKAELLSRGLCELASGLADFFNEVDRNSILEAVAGKRSRLEIDAELLWTELHGLLELEGLIESQPMRENEAQRERRIDGLTSAELQTLHRDVLQIARTSEKLAQLLANRTARSYLANMLRLEAQKRNAPSKRWRTDGSLIAEINKLRKDLTDLSKAANRLAAPLSIKRRMFKGSGDDYLNSLMLGLSGIFVTVRGISEHEYELSSSGNSIFIRFCSAVLLPILPVEVAGTSSLAKRWARLKQRIQPLGGSRGTA